MSIVSLDILFSSCSSLILDQVLSMEVEVESHTLSHRAEVFRSKLIEDFQIIASISEQGIKKVPVYTSADITSEAHIKP